LFTRLNGPRSRPTAAQKNLATPGIEPETPVLVARNSDHQTTEAVKVMSLSGIIIGRDLIKIRPRKFD
jgi:hypothetical protein